MWQWQTGSARGGVGAGGGGGVQTCWPGCQGHGGGGIPHCRCKGKLALPASGGRARRRRARACRWPCRAREGAGARRRPWHPCSATSEQHARWVPCSALAYREVGGTRRSARDGKWALRSVLEAARLRLPKPGAPNFWSGWRAAERRGIFNYLPSLPTSRLHLSVLYELLQTCHTK